MTGYPAAYTRDNLVDILDANDAVPTVTDDELDRIIELAKRRADARGEQNALEDTKTDCIIATEWTGFAQGEFGYDGDRNLNNFAMGVLDMGASVGKDATLFTDTYVIQTKWLESGDGRCKQIEQYVDDDYDGADPGAMWIPQGAQDWIAIIKLSDELILDSPQAADAM